MLIDNCQVDSCLDHILELLEILQQFLGKLKTIKGAKRIKYSCGRARVRCLSLELKRTEHMLTELMRGVTHHNWIHKHLKEQRRVSAVMRLQRRQQ